MVISLADNCNLSISELKQKLQMELYDWNCQKIETTELSVKNGEVTKELLRYFTIGKLGSNKSRESIIQYERYQDGKLTHETFTYYDEQGRTYVVKYVAYTYGEDNSVTTKISGYHYTYDENGNHTFHGVLPPEYGRTDDQPEVTEPTEPDMPIE